MLIISRAAFLSKAVVTSIWAGLRRSMLQSVTDFGEQDENTESLSDTQFELPIIPKETQIERLVAAYPDQHLMPASDGIIWPDGTRMYIGEPRSLPFSRILNDPELGDQLRVPYPKGKSYPVPDRPNGDPGRIRYTPFFQKMYGDSLSAVARQLVRVEWPPGGPAAHVWITRVNGIDQRLRAIGSAVAKLPAAEQVAARRLGGTFNWRPVAGTSRFSPHSFGIAIDLDPKLGDYWRWARHHEQINYRNRVSKEIVDIFESYGFIWGGKWFHFDTMHFEYRPELLM